MKKEELITMLLFKFLHNVADLHNPSGEALDPHDEVFVMEVEQCAKVIASLDIKKKR